MTRVPGQADRRRPAPRGMGFCHAARAVEERILAAGERRGFAVARLLTHWDEIVGAETARLARPLKLSWARGQRGAGLGATLTLATCGAAAPMVQMLVPQIRDRVNAALGHAAVTRVTLSQTVGVADVPGLAEAPAGFAHAARPAADIAAQGDPQSGANLSARASDATAGVRDPDLRAALEALARNVLSRDAATKGPNPTCNAR